MPGYPWLVPQPLLSWYGMEEKDGQIGLVAVVSCLFTCRRIASGNWGFLACLLATVVVAASGLLNIMEELVSFARDIVSVYPSLMTADLCLS